MNFKASIGYTYYRRRAVHDDTAVVGHGLLMDA